VSPGKVQFSFLPETFEIARVRVPEAMVSKQNKKKWPRKKIRHRRGAFSEQNSDHKTTGGGEL